MSALAGVRVVELASGIAGPVAGRLLAEAGADVVKVEPAGGDPGRTAQPVLFATANRGKRSVTGALEPLLAGADVLVHDLPAATARECGLDPEALAARHPHLVVATVPAYPAGHPLADLAATDAMVQAEQGFFDEQQGNRPGPVYIRLPFPSWSAAYLTAAGVVARLVQRVRTGAVLSVGTSLFQGGLAPAALYWQRWERLPAGLDRHTLPKVWPDAALSIFGCADGRFVQLAGAVGGWIESPPVLEALALADLVDLSEVGVTPDNWAVWNGVFQGRTSTEWRDLLAEADVPCIVVRELGECFTDEQARANGYVLEVDDPVLGRTLQAGPPVQPAEATGPAPAPGSTAVDDLGWDPRPRPAAAVAADPRPLAGLRVLDFGSVVAGPFGAQCLGDLGADVVKVEPLAGDRGRGLTQFAGCHRGKRSLAIDLKAPAAREALERLVRSSDVVLHNMRLGPAGRLGLDGPGLRATHPGVVFSHVSAYGPRGPMAPLPGYDPTAQALTGWEHANAGEGRTPIWLRNSVFDVQSGMAAALGALLGLYRRETTGTPGETETSLLAVGITAASEVAVNPADGTVTPAPVLDADQTGVDPAHRILRCLDGWVLVDAADAAQAAALAPLAAGLPDRGVDEALELLADAGVRSCRVAEDRLHPFLDSAVHASLGVARTLQTRGYGRLDLVAGFWDVPAPAVESVPDLGEHTRELLADLGYDDVVIDGLADGGVVRLAREPVTQGGRP